MTGENKVTGTVQLADDVFLTMVGLAATEVPGVVSLAGEIRHDEITHSKAKNLSRCVRVHTENEEVIVSVAIVTDGSRPLPEIGKDVENSIQNAVNLMTGKTVRSVSITIAGVETK